MRFDAFELSFVVTAAFLLGLTITACVRGPGDTDGWLIVGIVTGFAAVMFACLGLAFAHDRANEVNARHDVTAAGFTVDDTWASGSAVNLKARSCVLTYDLDRRGERDTFVVVAGEHRVTPAQVDAAGRKLGC